MHNRLTAVSSFDLGIDNINVTAYNIPPDETEAPSMAPSPFLSNAPTAPLNLDICVHDVMYEFKSGVTVHKKCFDLLADIEMVDDEAIIGKACVVALDNEKFQLEVTQTKKWELRKAFAWTGKSRDCLHL